MTKDHGGGVRTAKFLSAVIRGTDAIAVEVTARPAVNAAERGSKFGMQAGFHDPGNGYRDLTVARVMRALAAAGVPGLEAVHRVGVKVTSEADWMATEIDLAVAVAVVHAVAGDDAEPLHPRFTVDGSPPLLFGDIGQRGGDTSRYAGRRVWAPHGGLIAVSALANAHRADLICGGPPGWEAGHLADREHTAIFTRLDRVLSYLRSGEDVDWTGERLVTVPRPIDEPRMTDIPGHRDLKRALTTAANAGISTLVAADAAKVPVASLARRAAGTRVPERRDVERILRAYSAAGITPPVRAEADVIGGRLQRPFRAPHHTAPASAILGGYGKGRRPGEASLAYGGVLFLEDAARFEPATLEALADARRAGRVRAEADGSTPVDLPITASIIGCCPPEGYMGNAATAAAFRGLFQAVIDGEGRPLTGALR